MCSRTSSTRRGWRGIVGHGIALLERHDGLYGSFKLHENPDGDKALMLVKEGVLDTVSLEADPAEERPHREGVVRRVKAHLRGGRLRPLRRLPGATVLAVREQAVIDEELPEKLLPFEMDPELVERCRRLGVELPQRYQAHPDETDTPAQTGTSENGTRQTQGKPRLTEER